MEKSSMEGNLSERGEVRGETEQYIFKAGEMVTWTEDRVFSSTEKHGLLSPDEQHTVERFGKGPFEVVSVEDIPEGECNCGGGDGATHASDCPAFVRKGAGHSQWVTISTPEGEQKFSGRWLRPYEGNE